MADGAEEAGTQKAPPPMCTRVLLRQSHEWYPIPVYTVTGHFIHPTLLPYHLTMEVTMFYLLKAL